MKIIASGDVKISSNISKKTTNRHNSFLNETDAVPSLLKNGNSSINSRNVSIFCNHDDNVTVFHLTWDSYGSYSSNNSDVEFGTDYFFQVDDIVNGWQEVELNK